MRISDWSSDVCSSDLGLLDNGAEYTIVIGAHYDHLGEGRQGSSKDVHPEGKIHNGADDNASGVAGLLEMARYFSSGTEKEPYNVLFIAFSAEELGLLGSKYFAAHSTIPLDSLNFMVNMDMRSAAHTSELQSLMRISYAV